MKRRLLIIATLTAAGWLARTRRARDEESGMVAWYATCMEAIAAFGEERP